MSSLDFIELKKKETPNLRGQLLWEGRKLAKARADATLEVVVVETRDRPRTIVGQHPKAGAPLPANKVIRVEVAQPSWIRNLPGVFQDTDEEQADFLKRFLQLQQHILLQMDEKLESLHTYFDPRQTPEGFLSWLGSWVALGLQENWTPQRRREIILRAVELYDLRGTAAGLKLSLQLFADTDAEIEEFRWPYPGLVVGVHSTIGHQSTIARPILKTQCFMIKLNESKGKLPRERLRAIHAVVETEKPAHAYYAIDFEPDIETFETVPFLTVGVSRLGVDMRIGGRTDIPEQEEQVAVA